MRVLFTVSAWRGHYFPLVPLGWALQAAGHEVRVACAPSETGHLTAAGLCPEPVLRHLDMVTHARFNNAMCAVAGEWPYPTPPPDPLTGAAVADLAELDLLRLMREFQPRIQQAQRASAQAVATLVRGWRPDLVVHDLLSAEGLLAAALAGVPGMVHLWGPVGTHEAGLDLIPADHGRAFAEHGCPPPQADQISRVIDPCPDPVRGASRAARLPVRFVPYNGPGAVHTPAPPRRPRVCLIWGNSTAAIFGEQVFAGPKLLRALGDLDVEVVLTANQRDLDALGELPPRVRALANVPLRFVLPACDLVVHHGGAGSVMTALAAGVPQLAVPHGLDQHLIGDRIAAAGAGRCLPNHASTSDDVAAAVQQILADPAVRQAARQLRTALDELPTPAELVGSLSAADSIPGHQAEWRT